MSQGRGRAAQVWQRIALVLAAAGLVLLSSTGPVQASPPYFGLGLSPTRLVVPAGQISSDQIFTVSNQGSESVNIVVETEGFTARTDGGLEYQVDAPYSAANWIAVSPAQFSVPAGTRRAVTVHITVPAAPEPGDHQAALMFIVPSGKTSGNISIDRGIAAPVYITVPGPVISTASVIGLSAPGFALRGPVTIKAAIRSTGTVHRDFRATNQLFAQVNGDSVAFSDFTVPRGTVRDISTAWTPPVMCVCHIKLSVANTDGSVSTRSVRIIVFPLHLLGYVIGASLLLVLSWWLLRRHYRGQIAVAAAALDGASSVPRGDAVGSDETRP
jgi:hypothetical protein